MGSSTPAPTTAEIEAVSEVFFQVGMCVTEEGLRREKAAWFCDHIGRVPEAELLAAYVERETGVGEGGGLCYHYLGDASRCRGAIRYMRSRSGPAMDLPDTEVRRAKAAGYEDQGQWQRDHTRALAWERWCFDRRHLDFDERLDAIAEEFGWTQERAYDVLSEAARTHDAEATNLHEWHQRKLPSRKAPEKEPEDFGSMVRRMGLVPASQKRRDKTT